MKNLIAIILLSTLALGNAQNSEPSETKLIPTQDIDSFADSVSISGNRALVGGSRGGQVNGAGAAYIFQRDNNGWQQVDILNPADFDFGDEFGSAVSLMGDRAAISAINENNQRGAVYIFEFINNQWMETAKIIAADGEIEDNFGFSISLSNDKLLIGAPLHDRSSDPFDQNTGAAYVFEYNGNAWIQTAKLEPNVDIGAIFGHSVSLENNTAVIGAPNDGLLSNPGGSAFIFNDNGNNWLQTAKMIPSDIDDTAGFFGYAVDLSNDTVIIGDYISSRAYIFENQANNWIETEIILGETDSFFGFAVSISGQQALIGDPNHDSLIGRVFLYQANGPDWSEATLLTADDGLQGDQFGFNVDFDGSSVIVGAPGGNVSDPNRPDAAYVYGFDEIFTNGFE